MSTVIIGREAQLFTMRSELDARSLILSGPRRIGKTELLKHLVETLPDDWRGCRIDVEGATTVAEGVARIADGLRSADLVSDGLQRAASRLSEAKVAGTGFSLTAGAEQDPLATLDHLLRNAVENLTERQRLLICIDELPWLLDAIRQNEGPAQARQLLAALRHLRQREDLADRLRMVLTGSVGLAGLAKVLDASAELNDVQPPIELFGLDPDAGAALFESELAHRSISSTGDAAREACAHAGGSPHWIKVLAQRVKGRHRSDSAVTPADVEAAVEDLLQPRMRTLFDDEGRSHLVRRHGRERAGLLAAVLDAVADGPVPEAALKTAALSADPTLSEREARELGHLLIDEYYLELDSRQAPAQVRFLNPLFARWWQRYGGAP